MAEGLHLDGAPDTAQFAQRRPPRVFRGAVDTHENGSNRHEGVLDLGRTVSACDAHQNVSRELRLALPDATDDRSIGYVDTFFGFDPFARSLESEHLASRAQPVFAHDGMASFDKERTDRKSTRLN